MYTLALGVNNLCISLPPEVGQDVNKYNATLGHKANHSFVPNTEIYIFSIHPILGKTKILVAMKDIRAGSEITVDYGYDKNPVKPGWFLQQLKENSREMQTETRQRNPIFIL
jgi:SET domain-containing protein